MTVHDETTARSVSRGSYGVIVDALVGANVKKLFGLVGEDTVLFVADAVASGIEYVGTRHESVAVAMADGYSWSTQELGVCTVTRGPGVTNAMTAFRTAVQGGRRVLVITGDVPVGGEGPFYKNIDQEPICRSIGLEYFVVTDFDQLGAQLQLAIDSAKGGRPSVLAVAVDVLNAPLNDETISTPITMSPAIDKPQPASDADVVTLLELLQASSRPLIMAGLGASSSECRDQLIGIAQRTGALLGTSLLSKGLFSGVPYDVGVVGGFASDASVAVLGSIDLVIVVGAIFNAFSLGHDTLFRGIPIVQIDRDPDNIGRTRPVDVAVVGDSLLTLRKISAALERIPKGQDSPLHDPSLLASLRMPKFGGTARNGVDELDPSSIATSLNESLPSDRVVVLDSGRFMTAPGRFVDVESSGSVRHTAEAGSIGMGLGIALGASVGRPERTTVLFAGDGGFSMAIADLETAARHRVNLVMVVMDDHAYGSEKRLLAEAGHPTHTADLPPIDFVAIARAVNIAALPVSTETELASIAPALEMRQGGPLLIHCRIRPDITVTRHTWPVKK